MKNTITKNRVDLIAGRMKQLTSLALVTGTMAVGSSLHASVRDSNSISDRAVKIRQIIADTQSQRSSTTAKIARDAEVLLAQWGNAWTNWNNWNNWHNWQNWANWGNWGNF
jgi:hypothetical protein